MLSCWCWRRLQPSPGPLTYPRPCPRCDWPTLPIHHQHQTFTVFSNKATTTQITHHGTSHTTTTTLTLPNPQLPHHTPHRLQTRRQRTPLNTNLVPRHPPTFHLFSIANSHNNLQTTPPPPPPLRPPTTKRRLLRAKNARLTTLPPPLRNAHPQCGHHFHSSTTKSTR
jgi:hypothetical protein